MSSSCSSCVSLHTMALASRRARRPRIVKNCVVRLGSTFACYTQLRSLVSIHEGEALLKVEFMGRSPRQTPCSSTRTRELAISDSRRSSPTACSCRANCEAQRRSGYAARGIMQSIFSSAARLRRSMVGKKPGSRAGELKMLCTMPNRSSETLWKLRESCGSSIVPLAAMRHSPLCFAGILALAITSFNILPFLSRGSSACQPAASARLDPRPVQNIRQRMLWANPILACSVFQLSPHSAGARICRMTRVRKGSHSAIARSFGIFRNSA
jgi:hypothetical protein